MLLLLVGSVGKTKLNFLSFPFLSIINKPSLTRVDYPPLNYVPPDRSLPLVSSDKVNMQDTLGGRGREGEGEGLKKIRKTTHPISDD